MRDRQKVILEMLKKEKTVSPQAVYAHLAVYHKDEITVASARNILNKMTEAGLLKKRAGHGNARSEYGVADGKA